MQGQAEAALPESEGGIRGQSTMEARGQQSQTQEKSKDTKAAKHELIWQQEALGTLRERLQ